MVLGLCRQFHCLPSELYREDAELLTMIEIERLGGGTDGEHD